MTSSPVHKRKDKKEKKKRNKRKRKSNKSAHEEDTGPSHGGSGDEINLNEELHPIGYYINDREEMINQMFSVIKPHKLRAMLPPILKDSSIDELKAYCLDELLGMSWKRISSVLEGRELNSSSESSDESIVGGHDSKIESSSSCGTEMHWSNEEEEKSEVQETKHEEPSVPEDRSGPGNDMDTLEIGITTEEMGELLSCVPSNQQCDRKRPTQDQETSAPPNKTRRWKLKRPKSLHIADKAVKDSGDDKNKSSEKNTVSDKYESLSEENTEENEGKAYRDIIELEMRARAIRALLKQQAGAGADEASSSTASVHISKPPISFSEGAKESPGSNTVKKLQRSNPDVDSVSSIDVTAKPIRKRLKRNLVKPTDSSPQSPINKILLDKNVPDTMQNSESGTKDINKDVEVVGISSSLCTSKKSESSSHIRVPYSESKKKNEVEITCSKKKEDKRIFLKDREDGELSTDGEKSSDAVIETHPESGSSDIIILDDSEDDLLDPSSQKNVSSNIINVSKSEETKSVASEFTKQRKSKSGYKETDESNAIDDTVELKVSVKDNLSEKQNKSDDCINVSWAARWLQSKGVQKVVSTSKMCGKIRNRMKSAQKEKKVRIETPEEEKANVQSLVIEGSVNEYKMLDKPKSDVKESCAASDKKSTKDL